MAEVLVDTDIFIDHLRGADRLNPGRDNVSYSAVTRCELFAGKSDQEPAVAELLAPFKAHPVDNAVAELAGRIRRDTGVRTPDALIAATALHHKLVLVTRNRADFDRVPKLKIRAPR